VSRERGIAKDAGLVMLLILFSRFLGYVRERAIADVFGLNIETDIFRLAFNIPDLMYFLLIAGGLNAAFIPVFTSYLANDQDGGPAGALRAPSSASSSPSCSSWWS